MTVTRVDHPESISHYVDEQRSDVSEEVKP